MAKATSAQITVSFLLLVAVAVIDVKSRQIVKAIPLGKEPHEIS